MPGKLTSIFDGAIRIEFND